MTKPLIGITMGDPAGIGPEVTLKALQDREIHDLAVPIIFGTLEILDETNRSLQTGLVFNPIDSPVGISTSLPGHIAVVETGRLNADHVRPGQISAECGKAAADYIEAAIQAALAGEIDAITTGPIHKKALVMAGYPFLGHTEMLAARCGVKQPAMMLATPGRGSEDAWLRVTHASAHVPFSGIIPALTKQKLMRTIELTQEGVQSLGIAAPRLALAALNPHASDEGLMGDEEALLLKPLVVTARDLGFNLNGPIPADTVFLRAIQGEFDAVIALYHDQGHIPVKTYGFERAVNITLGLPITRTSVDHGTAFDIAAEQVADPRSMIEAIKLAAKIRPKT